MNVESCEERCEGYEGYDPGLDHYSIMKSGRISNIGNSAYRS
jgi:hypothetical protein